MQRQPAYKDRYEASPNRDEYNIECPLCLALDTVHRGTDRSNKADDEEHGSGDSCLFKRSLADDCTRQEGGKKRTERKWRKNLEEKFDHGMLLGFATVKNALL